MGLHELVILYLACIRWVSLVCPSMWNWSLTTSYFSLKLFYEQLAQGGTAVGTGLNSKKG